MAKSAKLATFSTILDFESLPIRSGVKYLKSNFSLLQFEDCFMCRSNFNSIKFADCLQIRQAGTLWDVRDWGIMNVHFR